MSNEGIESEWGDKFDLTVKSTLLTNSEQECISEVITELDIQTFTTKYKAPIDRLAYIADLLELSNKKHFTSETIDNELALLKKQHQKTIAEANEQRQSEMDAEARDINTKLQLAKWKNFYNTLRIAIIEREVF